MDPISYLAGILTLPAVALVVYCMWLVIAPSNTTVISCDDDPWEYKPGSSGLVPPWWWEHVRWTVHRFSPSHRKAVKRKKRNHQRMDPRIDLYGDGENERWPS